MTPEEQKIFDLQPESTKRLLRRQGDMSTIDDLAYFKKLDETPLYDLAQCKKADGSIDLNVRDISFDEYALYNGMRQKAGARIEKRWSEEQKAKPTKVSDEKREKALHAFTTGSTFDFIKKKFKDLMSGLFQPSYAEHVASEMRKNKEE